MADPDCNASTMSSGLAQGATNGQSSTFTSSLPLSLASMTAASAVSGLSMGSGLPLPTNFSSLWVFLTSFTALHDWLKLFLLGGLLETSRRLLSFLWTHFTESFFLTAEFEEHDETYVWMMLWLSKQKAWTQSRNVQVSTRRFGQDGTADLLPGEEAQNYTQKKKQMTHVPSQNQTHYVWFRGTPLQVTRLQIQSGDAWYSQKEEKLIVRMFTRSHKLLNALLLEAKLLYKAEGQERINVFVADQFNDWLLAGSRPKRPLSSVVLDKGIKTDLLEDCKDFMESEMWYAERGIPWRRGYLLFGCPGSGKTSLIHSLAGELGLDIYVISLSKRGLDDSTLNTLISRLPSKAMALIEDIDAAFYHGLSRETAGSAPADPSAPHSDGNPTPYPNPNVPSFPGAQPPPSTSSITLAGLLSAIDGVTAQEGRILFATTNKYEALDPALVRPGRLDVHVRFTMASKWQARELFKCFYPPTIEERIEKKKDDSEDGGVSVGKLVDLDEHSEKDGEKEIALSETSESSSPSPQSSITYTSSPSSTTRSPPRLTVTQVEALAALFADRIPEQTLSMAAIQGHLMKYKTRPWDAVERVEAWVKEEESRQKQKSDGQTSTNAEPLKEGGTENKKDV